MVNVEDKKGITHLVRAVLSAATQVGEDGLGRGGLASYLRRLARAQPKLYFPLLVGVIRDQEPKPAGNPNGEWPNWMNAFSTCAKKTDITEDIILAAAQVGEDGLGKGGLDGYLRRFARAEPKLFSALLASVIPYQSICDEEPQLPALTREELEKKLRDDGIQLLFHGDELDENGCPISDGGPWPRIRNIHTGEEFDCHTRAPIPNRRRSSEADSTKGDR